MGGYNLSAGVLRSRPKQVRRARGRVEEEHGTPPDVSMRGTPDGSRILEALI